MCNPVLAIMAVGIGLQVAGQFKGAQSEGQAAEYQSGVSEYNAKAAEWDAKQVTNEGVQAEAQHRQQVKQFAGSQIATMGGSGTEVNTGTNLQIQEDTARMGEVDALTIRQNYWRKASSLRQQAKLYRYESDYYKKSAENIKKWGWLGAGSTLLTQGGSMASRYYPRGSNA